MADPVKTVNEGTTAFLTVAFTDKDGNAVVPDSIRYRIDDVISEGEVLAWATYPSPASSIEIELTAAQAVIIDTENPHEDKMITVEATYDTDDIITSEAIIRVTNLSFYPAA